MVSDLIRAWRKSCQVTQMLLDAIPAAHLGDQYSKRTRTIAAQFAHIHYVRVRNLDFRGGPDLKGSLVAFAKGSQPKKGELKKALKASSSAMEKLLEAAESGGKLRSWKGTLASYVAYHVAHEAHHRALAIVCLRISGHKAPQESVYGIWDAWRKAD